MPLDSSDCARPLSTYEHSHLIAGLQSWMPTLKAYGIMMQAHTTSTAAPYSKQLASLLHPACASSTDTGTTSLMYEPLLTIIDPCMCIAVYVVFGATGGIGSELCKRLGAQPGANVVMVGRDEAKVESVKASLGVPIAASYTADVTDAGQVEKVINAVSEAYGRIDGVANCVGSIVLKSAHTTSEAEFDQTVRLNLYSCFNILKPTVKKMMATGGGSIAFCSSAVAKHGIPNHEAIAAAKAGVVGE